ncbi:hypothetical protein RI367_004122 [Sorochytrium milnesiophthora]
MHEALLLVLALPLVAHAAPFLNTVNSVDAQGRQCPTVSFPAQACAPICVQDIAKCPQAYMPTCPPGQSYCMDGNCYPNPSGQPALQFCQRLFAQNTNLAPTCSCPASYQTNADFVQYANWFPCAPATVDVNNIQPADKVTATTTNCTNTIPLNADQLWINCPTAATMHFTFREPVWVSLWSFLSAEAALFAAFFALKHVTEATRLNRQTRRTAQSEDDPLAVAYCEKDFYDPSPAARAASVQEQRGAAATPASDEAVLTSTDALVAAASQKEVPPSTLGDPSLASDESPESSTDVRFHYYVDSAIGTVVFWSLVGFGIYLQIFLALIVFDYYATLTVPTNASFFLSADLVPPTFVTMWHVMVVYMVVWKVVGFERARAFFRIRVHDVGAAQYVLVAKKVHATMATDYNETSGLVQTLLRLVNRVETFAERIFDLSTEFALLPISRTHQYKFPYFTHDCTRYIFCPLDNMFRPYPYAVGSSVSSYAALSNAISAQGGLADEQVIKRTELIGYNQIDIPKRSAFGLWVEEVSGWFYLYQGCCLWVWYYFAYWQMGVVLTVVILAASIVKTGVRYSSHRRVRELASVAGQVNVLRNSTWQAGVSSKELVPGDLVLITPGLLSVDMVLCSGEAVLDESSLTGESRPVRKFAVPDEDHSPLDINTHKRHILLAGTTVVQADAQAYGLIMKTSTGTSRGALIRKILHPVPVKFIFNEQLKVVLAAMLTWGVICFCLVIYEMGNGGIGSWFYALFIISETVSPLLPAVLVAGQSVSAGRLVREHKIFCLDLTRITMSGKTQIFAFDKTGTLTKEGLNMWGFLPITADTSDEKPARLVDDIQTLPPAAIAGLATCHSLHIHEQILLGNPVDVAMFESTEHSLSEDAVVAPTGEAHRIVKRHEFLHSKQTMAVIVQTFDAANAPRDGPLQVYVKGSFERVRGMARSVPAWYDDVAKSYAKMGGYVLALGTKALPAKVTLAEAATLPRAEIECDVELLGLIVFRNTLKPDSKDAIHDLQRGSCRTVMITGDNVFTGIYIARECGLSPARHDKVLPCLYAELDKTAGEVVWRDYDTETIVSLEELEQRWESRAIEPIELGVSGDAWTALIESGQDQKYLLGIRVWARMSPDQKVDVVRRLMTRGITAMCGDGGNDCGALNAAHVGIALSEAEASIVAPFSSKTKSIRSCVDLIREGRAALATSFAGYKFLIMYGLTMSSMCLTMYYFSVVLPQWIWIFIDGIIVVSTSWALTQARPLPTLLPRRPTARLLGPQTLISVLSLAALNWAFLFCSVAWLFRQNWFRCHEFDSNAIDTSKWWLLGDNYESALISAIIVPQFINNGAVFNFGYYFRRAWIRNYVYVALYVAFLCVIYTLVLSDPTPFTCWFRMSCGSPDVLVSMGYPRPTWNIPAYNSLNGNNVLPHDFRIKLFIVSLVNIALAMFVERVVILGPVREWIRSRRPLKRSYIPQ